MEHFSPPLDQHGDAMFAGTGMTRRRKAAIIVRLLLNEGIELPLGGLPHGIQTSLAEEIASMRYVDGDTMQAVINEFMAEIEQFGLTFPGGIDGALQLLGDHLSPEAAAILKAQHGRDGGPDPWAFLAQQEPEKLARLLMAESPEIAAVAMSKLPSQTAAAVLGQMPGPQARRVAIAISRTSNVPPAAVARIGAALADRIADAPKPAFETEPEKRMGEILDAAPAATRDDVLEGLEETDAELAAKVRLSVFTFADIPKRLEERDVPALTRAVEQPVLITALAGAGEKAQQAVEFILANMSQRMAGQIRDEMSEREAPTQEETDAAMTAITAALRGMDAAGEIRLRSGQAAKAKR